MDRTLSEIKSLRLFSIEFFKLSSFYLNVFEDDIEHFNTNRVLRWFNSVLTRSWLEDKPSAVIQGYKNFYFRSFLPKPESQSP